MYVAFEIFRLPKGFFAAPRCENVVINGQTFSDEAQNSRVIVNYENCLFVMEHRGLFHSCYLPIFRRSNPSTVVFGVQGISDCIRKATRLSGRGVGTSFDLIWAPLIESLLIGSRSRP